MLKKKISSSEKKIELKNELKNCEEETHELENTIDILKEQLDKAKNTEEYNKLKAKLDHIKKEPMFVITHFVLLRFTSHISVSTFQKILYKVLNPNH